MEQLKVIDWEQGQIINCELGVFLQGMDEGLYEKQSHFFHGRYENIYLDKHIHPALSMIIDKAKSLASEILRRPEEQLSVGFWLNMMNRGDVTTLHSHDDDDELLSAVYYVQVPDNSGLFRYHLGNQLHEIKPVEGRFMFFRPDLPHEVTEHKNIQPRLSIGMNFGPKT